MYPQPFSQWEREIVPSFSCPSNLLCVYLPVPLTFPGSRQGPAERMNFLCPSSCLLTLPCLTSPRPGWLRPCQETHRQGGFLPTLVPTSPYPRSHPPLPESNSPTLSSPTARGSPYCPEQGAPASSSRSAAHSQQGLKASLGASRPSDSQKDFPATLRTACKLFSTHTKRQRIISIPLYGILSTLYTLLCHHCHYPTIYFTYFSYPVSPHTAMEALQGRDFCLFCSLL